MTCPRPRTGPVKPNERPLIAVDGSGPATPVITKYEYHKCGNEITTETAEYIRHLVDAAPVPSASFRDQVAALWAIRQDSQ